MEFQDLIIRPMEMGDKEKVENFYDSMGFESCFFFNSLGANKKYTLRFFGDNPDKNSIHWLAIDTETNRMVGYVFLFHTNMKVVHFGIAIADDYKGKHLGRRLIDTTKKWCLENGKGGILLTTHPANIRGQMVYRRNGFVQIGTSNMDGEFLFLYNFPQEEK